LPSLFIVLIGLRIAERGDFGFYIEDLFPSISDAQEPHWCWCGGLEYLHGKKLDIINNKCHVHQRRVMSDSGSPSKKGSSDWRPASVKMPTLT
jgi:hypothetical protein